MRALIAAVALAVSSAWAQTDPLPSWNEGPAKEAIKKFVADARSVPEPERVAVFDNDGTLWAEQPMYFQLAFALDRIKAEAGKHPEWKTTEPYRSVLAGDMKGLMASGEKGLLEIVATTHSGMTTDEFARVVKDWTATAQHPRFKKPYVECVYAPMIELLVYLRANGFKTLIVSGGGVEFVRAFAEKVYGIPPEQVIGSSIAAKYEVRNGTPVLVKQPKVEFVDDKEGKPVGINRFIGRRPILAFGNSDGDHEMLLWTAAGTGPRFMGIVHHTDADREWAYDRTSHIGKLDKAWDDAKAKGWTVVDMKKDWKRVFAFQDR